MLAQRILVVVWLALWAHPATASVWNWISRDFEVLMNTHGEISFAPYVQGEFRQHEVTPGYRSDFRTFVDFFVWKGFISNWLIANSTIIERPPHSAFELDRIRYTLTPGYRYEFDRYLISGLLLHECIHTISKPEEQGAVWWNSFQFGFGSKAAYQLYLVNKYGRDTTSRFPDWDYQVNVGAFLWGDQSVWIGQNHDYRYESFYLLRLHWARFGAWGLYSDWNHHLWFDRDWKTEQKTSISLNLLLRGRRNLAAVYYQYFPFDNFAKDNQDGLGAAGFKIVF